MDKNCISINPIIHHFYRCRYTSRIMLILKAVHWHGQTIFSMLRFSNDSASKHKICSVHSLIRSISLLYPWIYLLQKAFSPKILQIKMGSQSAQYRIRQSSESLAQNKYISAHFFSLKKQCHPLFTATHPLQKPSA